MRLRTLRRIGELAWTSCWVALVAAAALPNVAFGQAAAPTDGLAYPVGELEIIYIDPNPAFPTPDKMSAVEVELSRASNGLVAPRTNLPLTTLRLSDLPKLGTQQIFESGLRSINQQLVFEFNRRDFHAIVVSPISEDIDRRTGRDLRPAGTTKLRLGVYAGRVKDLHTIASTRVEAAPDEATDRPEHAWIKQGSPIQAAAPNDLVRKDQLDEYIAQLNRHPARRVDAELRPARTPGGVVVDYYVAETKPWWAYSQLDDTGTEQTTELRQRFGAVHSNLTGRDDLLQFDYITGNFNEVNAVAGSYEIPFDRSGGIRLRGFGIWSTYDASVIAIGNQSFSSDQIDLGLQLIGTVFQAGELFLDAFGGMQWERIQVQNSTNIGNQAGEEEFALMTVGLRSERITPSSSVRGELSVLHNFSGLAGTSEARLRSGALGRTVSEADFTLARWNAEASVFVPAILPRSWRDPAILSAKSLAHEVGITFRGQQSFGDRLIAQQEYVAGGMMSVRGYPESATAGDNVQLLGLEYRLHVPRLLAPDRTPIRMPGVGAFHARPKYDFTFPDWDLVVRAFVDYAHVDYEDQEVGFEFENNLVGAGAGLELRLLRYFSARVDYGIALKEANLADAGTWKSGDDQVHFSVTLLY